MPQGHPRSEEEPAQPITAEEAKRRGLWGVFRARKGSYVCSRPGIAPPGYVWVAWAVDEESALRACVERGRDDRFPSMQARADRADFGRRKIRGPRPHPPLPKHPVDKSLFACGHPRTHENSYVYGARNPICLTCRRKRSREAYKGGRDSARKETP